MLQDFLTWLEEPRTLDWDIAHHEVFDSIKAKTEPINPELNIETKGLIRSAGIKRLYSHQAQAIRLALSGKNVVLSTSTASGKTLCYQIPVLDRLVTNPKSHALFLFPLKALERDQCEAFRSLVADSGIDIAVYDGDTPDTERRKIRANPPRVIVTNPDMLHLGFLAFHDSWKSFFGNLAYVALDEAHSYKGIFGSHINQLMQRLKRVCAYHGASPQFIACSATIANPGEFVSSLIGEEVSVVCESGAPCSQRHFVFLNPYLSPYTIAARLFVKSINLGLKTIVFTRARKITELITLWVMSDAPQLRKRVSSYRAGFLPEERREIEKKLFGGALDGVISTSALELGIDVGGLDVCILVGYPGTIVNTWQRGGRVGRGGQSSAIVMIAGADALDQYFLKNPSDFFQRGFEEAVLDPFNVEVLKRHLPCAAAELPLRRSEDWLASESATQALKSLIDSGELYESANGTITSLRSRPHRGVDLRSIGNSFAIFSKDGKKLIGVSGGNRAYHEVHLGAIYLHRSAQYAVTKFDPEKRNVFVEQVNYSYYTKTLSEKTTTILGAPIRSRDFDGFTVREARLKVIESIHGYEKRRTSGQELIATEPLDLQPEPFETVGIWIEISDDIKQKVEKSSLHFMGGIHALEHAAISMFPLFALCDRNDIGGISTPKHEQVCKSAVFIYDGYPGGVGLAHKAFDVIKDLLEKTRDLVSNCECEIGCPSCIHSPKCGSGNKPLDKAACLMILDELLNPQTSQLNTQTGKPQKKMETDAAASKSRVDQIVIVKNNNRNGDEMKITPKQLGKVVIFDLETQMLADEVGGWSNISKMMLSLAVTYSDQDGYQTFTEKNVDALINNLITADMVVGFNHVSFDYVVLSAYTSQNLKSLNNLDILLEAKTRIGFRLSLNHLAEHTLGIKKSGSGLDAARWFKQGKMDLIEKYCRDDVRITKELYEYGRDRGHVLYSNKGSLTRINVDWP